MIEEEYAKLEPYINIFSSSAVTNRSMQPISEEDLKTLKELLEMMKEGRVRIEAPST